MPSLSTKYEIEKLCEYGQLIENAKLVGGMDKHFGKVLPVFEFDYIGDKYMTWGIKRVEEELLKLKMGSELKIIFAPGKSRYVLEVDDAL